MTHSFYSNNTGIMNMARPTNEMIAARKAAEGESMQSGIIGRKIKVLELAKAIEILGNQKTFTSRNADMVVTEKGVLAVSKKTGETVLIFDADCLAAKLE